MRSFRRYAHIATLVASLAVLPGCNRSPQPPAQQDTRATDEAAIRAASAEWAKAAAAKDLERPCRTTPTTRRCSRPTRPSSRGRTRGARPGRDCWPPASSCLPTPRRKWRRRDPAISRTRRARSRSRSRMHRQRHARDGQVCRGLEEADGRPVEGRRRHLQYRSMTAHAHSRNAGTIHRAGRTQRARRGHRGFLPGLLHAGKPVRAASRRDDSWRTSAAFSRGRRR